MNAGNALNQLVRGPRRCFNFYQNNRICFQCCLGLKFPADSGAFSCESLYFHKKAFRHEKWVLVTSSGLSWLTNNCQTNADEKPIGMTYPSTTPPEGPLGVHPTELLLMLAIRPEAFPLLEEREEFINYLSLAFAILVSKQVAHAPEARAPYSYHGE